MGSDFNEKYKYLAGILAGDFHDALQEDDLIARMAVRDFDVRDIEILLDECHSALNALDQEWGELTHKANRTFKNANETREWLLRMHAIWEACLREKKGLER